MTDETKGKKGMPPFDPTEDQREQVRQMVGFGLTHREIAMLTKNPRTGRPISVITLRKKLRAELDEGEAYIKARVIGNLVRRACANHPSAVTAAIWFTKARCGWKSTDRIEHSMPGNTGVLVAPAATSPSAWVANQRSKNAKRVPPARSA